jgi:hypothetical protein
MPSKTFKTTKLKIMNDTINLSTDTFEMRLIKTVGSPAQEPSVDASVVDDIAALLHTAAPVELVGKQIIQDAATGEVYLVFSPDPTFLAVTGDRVPGIVVNVKNADPTKQHLVCYNAFTQEYPPNGADLTVDVPPQGVLKAK